MKSLVAGSDAKPLRRRRSAHGEVVVVVGGGSTIGGNAGSVVEVVGESSTGGSAAEVVVVVTPGGTEEALVGVLGVDAMIEGEVLTEVVDFTLVFLAGVVVTGGGATVEVVVDGGVDGRGTVSCVVVVVTGRGAWSVVVVANAPAACG